MSDVHDDNNNLEISSEANNDTSVASHDYKVGYRNPPKHTQFKKGSSGHKPGRPPKDKSIAGLLEAELNMLVTMKENGREIRIPKRAAIVKRLVNTALNGAPRSIEYLIKYCHEHGAPDPFVPTNTDVKIVQDALRRAFGKTDDKEDAQ